MAFTKSIVCILLAGCVYALPLIVNAQDGLLAEAQGLLAEGQGEEAYALLLPELERRAGEPDYDYLFGLAALEVGEPTEAVFAFERVLLVQPDHLQARAELARAYYLMGESGAARREFETVKQEDVPPQVKETINRYLAAMDYPYDPKRARLNVYLEFGGGYDSNVNSAATTSQVFIPAAGVVPIDPLGQEQDSGIGSIEAGFRFAHPLRSNLNLYGGANAKWRQAFDATEFDQAIANGLLGLHLVHGANEYRLAVLGQSFLIDGDRNRNLGGVNAQWQRNLNAQNQITLYGQAAALRYPGQGVRDADQYAGGLAWAHAFDVAGQPVALLSVFGGTEDNKTSSRPDIGRDFVGARLGGQYSINDRTTAFGAVTYQYSRYGGLDPQFEQRRTDDFVTAALGFRYAIHKNWSIRPEIGYTHNDSTLAINEFDRWQAMVFLRNDFF